MSRSRKVLKWLIGKGFVVAGIGLVFVVVTGCAAHCDGGAFGGTCLLAIGSDAVEVRNKIP